ncbi:MAG: DUF2484 family protein [Tranquillimonas sp.]
MSLPLVLAVFWVVAANIAALLPRGRGRWAASAVLIALGVPLLGLVTYQQGPWVGLLAFAAALSILRWPFLFLGRWLRSRLMRRHR